MWKKLYISGNEGSEGGRIIKDEEYNSSCRITLEKCPDYYAITCGVYGSMVHTAFCGMEDCMETYESMKRELAEFVDKDLTEAETYEFYEYFTKKYE